MSGTGSLNVLARTLGHRLERHCMNKFRNPRYACEALERKLSPSAFVGSLSDVAGSATIPSAEISPYSSPTTNGDPPPGDGVPPVVPPANPTGPVGPA